jgi:hypothetical protein
MPCAKCKTNEAKEGQRYCHQCHAAYMRDYRRLGNQRSERKTRRQVVEQLMRIGNWPAAEAVRNL